MRETLVVVDRLDSHGDLLEPPPHRTSLTSTATNAAWRGRAPHFSPSDADAKTIFHPPCG